MEIFGNGKGHLEMEKGHLEMEKGHLEI